MSWKGFTQESKSYMNYPKNNEGRFAEWNHSSVVDGGWTVKERRKAKLVFWIKFPRAWVKFYWYTFYDYLKGKVN